jgi:type IV fimbrial biogenesis protein FimT
MKNKTMKYNNLQTGFTLLELLVVVAIAGILATLAAPSFNTMLERRRLVSATEAVLSDLRWTRSEGIKRNIRMRLTFNETGNEWNYSIHPDGTDPIDISTLLKQVSSTNFPNTGLTSNRSSIVFDNIRGGTGTNCTVTMTSSPSNFQMQVVISPIGRIRTCAVGASLGGYEVC